MITLKDQVKSKLIVNTFLFFILLIMFFYTYHCNHKLKEKINAGLDSINKLNLKISKISSRELILSDNFEVWQEISFSNVYSSSYVLNLDSLLKQLCEKYYMFNNNIKISSPSRVEEGYNNSKYIDVIKNSINIQFNALSDEYVLKFIYSIKYDIPGYIIINSLNLIKNEDLIFNSVNDRVKKGNMNLVRGELTFDLYSILGKFGSRE